MTRGVTAILKGGPCEGERVPLDGHLEILKMPVEVPVEEESDIYRHPDPLTEMRVVWYRRGLDGSSHYHFDRWET